MVNIKDCVGKDKNVTFVKFQNNEMWYECDNGFQFPIPLYDLQEATFLAKDKSSLFLRWITRQIKVIKEAENGTI